MMYEIDETTFDYCASIARQEERIRDACEEIRSDIGSLIGRTIPFDHHGHIQFGEVIAVRGFGRIYGIQVRNLNTGVTREVSTYDMFEGLRKFHVAQELGPG